MKSKKIVYWTPRLFSIIFIAFISIFALDVFGENQGIGKILIALFMHLIPSFILLIILIISWKRELVGAICFLILTILFTFFFKTYQDFIVFLIVSFPVLIISLGFFASWKISLDEKLEK